MQHVHLLQRTQAKQAAQPASATDSTVPTEPAVATLRTVPALPAVATLAVVATLPAVATLQVVAALATVAALWRVATLANVPALRSVAALANVPALPLVAALANEPVGASGSSIGRTVGFRSMEINGSGALIAGGASGLGEATARRLHASGARVLIADLNEERGAALAADLGTRAAFVRADVTDPDAVQEAVQAAVSAAADDGGLRISVCCAGVGWAERIAGKRGPHTLQPFETVIRINLIGTFNVLRLAAAAMVVSEPTSTGERGVCINTASIAAFDGQIGQVSYSASKGGIVGLTLPAARDLAGVGIRVCTIAPGTFDTPLLAALPEEARQALGEAVPFPPRLGRPDEFARLAAHIVENEMLNGEVIRLDGALRMPPR
jgi:NAD(P)-dependent dehydrogenase (short-subunit alcohol dehydrogenase family)